MFVFNRPAFHVQIKQRWEPVPAGMEVKDRTFILMFIMVTYC
jgi:hypothetical protein